MQFVRHHRLALLIVGSLPFAVACGDDETAVGGAPSGGASQNGGASAIGGAGGGGGASAGPMSATITRYGLRFDLATATLVSTLTLDVTQAGACFTVPSELDPTEAAFDGVAASVSRKGGDVEVCGATLAPGEHALEATTLVPKKKFLGLDVGYATPTDLSGETFSYLLSWVGGCDHFGPCDDAPDRLVHFDFDVVHPAGTVALCPGTRSETSPTETHCELSGATAPTYSAYAFAIDPAWQAAPLVSAGGVDVTMFEVPGGTLAQTLDEPSLAAFLDWSTARFGALPYGSELRIAGAPTYWLGFEHPANIVVMEDLDQFDLPYAAAVQHVTMHEIAHQWAGDAATIASAPDFAWKEAIAEYVAYVFEDESRPPVEAAASLAYWDGISIDAAYHVRPTDEPPPAVEDFYSDVYGPGPMTLFIQLEPLIGRDAVLAGIAQFLAGGGVRSVADLQAALEAASGEDLGDYFDAWVFGSGAPVWPAFQVTTSDLGGGQVQVTVTQVQPGGVVFPCHVAVRLSGATTQTLVDVDFGLHPAQAAASAIASFPESVLSTAVDPEHRLIDQSAGVARSHWPVYVF